MTPPHLLHPAAVLIALVKSEEWETIRRLATISSPECFRAMASSVTSCSDELNGITLLHAIVRQRNPPLDIVAFIIKICPEMLSSSDCFNRTPLHVAAGSKKSSPLSLKLIACAYPAACVARDRDGKTPLHYSYDSSSGLFDEEDEEEDDDDDQSLVSSSSATPTNEVERATPSHDAIAAILSESMAAATIEDADEMSPVEHAIISGASLKTVKMLQAAAAKSLQSRSVPCYVRKVTEDSFEMMNKRRRISSPFDQEGENFS
jgi:ankyrin repeat protein